MVGTKKAANPVSNANVQTTNQAAVQWTLDFAQPLGDELGSVFHGGEPA